SQGDRIKAVIVDVHTQPKGPQVVLSRTDPRLLIKLFEMEVPEIYDGTVVIKDAVREPGERAKIAVMSRERDVDPVGACVGMKGSRVQSIIRELRGEKIDIIPWKEDIVDFAQEALAESRSQVNVHDIDDMPAEWADQLEEAGYDDLDSVLNASPDDLTAIDGVDEEMAKQMIDLARKHEQLEEQAPEELSAEEEAGEPTQEEASVE